MIGTGAHELYAVGTWLIQYYVAYELFVEYRNVYWVSVVRLGSVCYCHDICLGVVGTCESSVEVLPKVEDDRRMGEENLVEGI